MPHKFFEKIYSPAFQTFVRKWFDDTHEIAHGELDFTFLKGLSADELAIARDLIRQKLYLKYTHIVQTSALLRDLDAVPQLQELLSGEQDLSRRLVIAGALWNLIKDPIFVSCLHEAKLDKGMLMFGSHLLQVLWLNDERAIDILIEMLDHSNAMVSSRVLSFLNQIELGLHHSIHSKDLQHSKEYYKHNQSNPSFRSELLLAVRRYNASHTSGEIFGFYSPVQESESN